MKAIEVLAPGKLRIAERPLPGPPAAGEAVVRIRAAGICGSDVHILHGRNPFATYPRIIGHEAAGEVFRVGGAVRGLEPGDAVAVDNVFACGDCYACRAGRPNVCRQVSVLGVHRDGVFQEYIAIPADHLHKLPAGLPWDQAATVETFSIGAQAVSRGQVQKGENVLICGAGPTGLVSLQAARRLGARIAVTDTVDARLDRARAMGAHLALNPAREDIVARIMDFTGGEGANVIIEATGAVSVLEQAVAQLVSQAGRIVVLGFPAEAAKIVPADIMRRELDIRGSRLNNRQFPAVISWLAGKEIDPGAIISHTLPFTAVAEGMRLFADDPAAACKIILTF